MSFKVIVKGSSCAVCFAQSLAIHTVVSVGLLVPATAWKGDLRAKGIEHAGSHKLGVLAQML